MHAGDPFLPLQTLLLRFEFEDENEDVYAPPFNEILCAAHWNSLRRLQLEEICCDMAPSVAFLEAHPTIEELSIDRSFGVDEVDFGDDEKPIVIDTPVLPNLRRLRAPNGWIVAILKSHPDRIPPVEDLRGLHMPTDDQRQTILDLLKRMPDLRRIALHESSIVQDLHALSLAVPQLTWIELHPRSLFDGFGPGFALKERRLSDQQLVRSLRFDCDFRLTSSTRSCLRLNSWMPWRCFVICSLFTGYAYSARATTDGTPEYQTDLLNGARG